MITSVSMNGLKIKAISIAIIAAIGIGLSADTQPAAKEQPTQPAEKAFKAPESETETIELFKYQAQKIKWLEERNAKLVQKLIQYRDYVNQLKARIKELEDAEKKEKNEKFSFNNPVGEDFGKPGASSGSKGTGSYKPSQDYAKSMSKEACEKADKKFAEQRKKENERGDKRAKIGVEILKLRREWSRNGDMNNREEYEKYVEKREKLKEELKNVK